MNIDVYKMLAYDEGIRLNAYRDTMGILTVGIGHNLESDPAGEILKRHLNVGDKITEIECQKLFNRDKTHVYHDLDENIKDWSKYAVKYQFILVNMCFNMGINRLLKWANTISAMRRDDHEAVIAGIMNSRYAKQVPNRAKRLCELAKGNIPHEYS